MVETLRGEMEEDDLFISADVDEVMSRSALQSLRWCEVVGRGPLTGALWVPMGRLDAAFRCAVQFNNFTCTSCFICIFT